MPLKVVTFCTYLTSTDFSWRPDDYNAHDFVFAVKDRNIKGNYSYCWVRGKWHRFENHERERCVAWYAQMAGDYLRAEGPKPPFVLVPFPSSKVDVKFKGINRTTVLAKAIAAEYGDGATVRDVLRFNQPMKSANEEGGPRDAATIYANLSLIGTVKGQRIVMVDDVLTSGGHLMGGAAKLRIDGAAKEICLAVCAGRADREQVKEPFGIRLAELADYEP